MNKFSLLVRFLCLSLLASPALAGSGSHGGDIRDAEEGSAWFERKDGVIHYCVNVSPDFGVDAPTALTTIQAAFDTWKAYVQFRGVPAFYQIFRGELTTSAQPMAACDGSEDLTFLLGVKTPEVLAEMPHYNDPIAFATRTKYDVTSGWGKGFIWIGGPRPVHFEGGMHPIDGKVDWTVKDTFLAMVTHEIGHVLGNDHAPATIMNEDIALFVVYAGGANGSAPYPIRTSIDWESELLSCDDMRMCNPVQALPGVLGDAETNMDIAAYFLGHAVTSPVESRAMILGSQNALQLSGVKYELQIKDGDNWVPFPVLTLDTVHVYTGTAFHRITPEGIVTGTGVDTQISVGTIKTASGELLHVIVKHNAGGTPLAISSTDWFLHNSYSREVFSATPGWHP